MDTQDSSPDEQDTKALPVTDAMQPLQETPTFTGEQVEFLLRKLAVPGQPGISAIQSIPSANTSRARGGYKASFGWMHLATPEFGIQLAIGLGMLVLGTFYLVNGLSEERQVQGNLLTLLQPVLLFAIGTFVLVRAFVKWRNSRLYTTASQVVYEIRPCLPLFILRGEQRAKLPKIDASVYSQNFIELTFGMNSGTLTLDTAAQGDKGLHLLKGVKDISLLREDIE